MIKEPGKIISLPGFYYFNQLNPADDPVAHNHRNIPGIIQRSRKCLEPRFHLLLVNAGNAHPFNTAKEFASVLQCDNNTFPHDSVLDRHPVNKPGP